MRSKNRFGSLWDELTLKEQDDIVEKIITAEEDSELMEMLNKYDLTQEQKDFITKKTIFPSGTTSFCREFTETVIEEILKEKCQLHTAIQNLGYRYAEQTVEKYDTLPYYGKVLTGSTMGIKANYKNEEEQYGKISNPTVHIALNQTRTVVNTLIKEYGKPEQIVVEVSRDLKASREAKAKIQQQITQNQKRNEILNKNIRDANPNILYPNRADRLKFKLWEELNPEDALDRRCIYCGKQISGADIFNDDTIQIEHILPFSRTLWDSEHNKTVAHTKCNQDKGNKSPFEAFGHNPYGYNWNDILERVSHLKDPQKKKLFAENAIESFDKDSSFISRQLTDNAYLSKMALRYLKAVVEKDTNVWAVTGGMTKLLRDKWDIDSILKRKIDDKEIAHFNLKDEQIGTYKKNRYDHRHHALDACVIALIDRSMVQEISNLNKVYKKNKLEVPQMTVLRSELIDKTKNIVVSHKPDHGAQGKLSKETLLGKIKCPELLPISEIKTEKDILMIRNDKVRGEFEKSFTETKDIKKTVKELKDIYPQLWIYKEYFVSRESILGLTEKNIDSVIDKSIQEKLKIYVEQHKGEKIEVVMQKFSEETGIKKVRCKNRVQTPIEIKNIDGTDRYLCPEDYFATVIWEIPAKKDGAKPTYEGVFIRRDEVDENNQPKVENKPHPAAKKIGIIHKNDCIEFVDNGVWYKARIAGLGCKHKSFDIRPLASVTDCSDWMISTTDNMTEPCWSKKDKKTNEIRFQTGQNEITINTLFGEKQARFITVNPIGKVFRKKC